MLRPELKTKAKANIARLGPKIIGLKTSRHALNIHRLHRCKSLIGKALHNVAHIVHCKLEGA